MKIARILAIAIALLGVTLAISQPAWAPLCLPGITCPPPGCPLDGNDNCQGDEQ
jgi:hypothetical protein